MKNPPSNTHRQETHGQEQLIGSSPAVKDLQRQIEKYARSDAEILIQGETGSGKGLCAELVHFYSSRRHQPFIEINCGAIPHGLIASELFGHKKGAFTGAMYNHAGFIQRADGGTLFLDEVADMPAELQVALLRFLDRKKIQSLGADCEIVIDTRVIAASHIDLPAEVERGNFREDLYYRLNILPLNVPPLRSRQQDVLDLAEYFLSQIDDSTPHRLSAKAKSQLLYHHWPGNVRELKNALLRALVMSDGKTIDQEHLSLCNGQSFIQSTSTYNKSDIEQLLVRNQHNISASARQLGISRTTLYKLLKKYRLC